MNDMQKQVNDLLIPGVKEWDCELIHDLFGVRDVNAIQKVPLYSGCLEDIRIWHFSKNGCYTVKSGYRLAVNLMRLNEDFGVAGNWHKLWHLQIPPKVRNFLWRAGRDCLPTRSKLQSRGIPVPLCCLMCNRDVENSWHLFFTCSFAQNCWSEAHLWNAVELCLTDSERFGECLFRIMASLNHSDLGKFYMVLWNIWRQRIKKVWNCNCATPRQTVFSAMKFLYDWVQAKLLTDGAVNGNQVENRATKWQKPHPSFLKCNVDAAFLSSYQRTGVGMILRDEAGQFVACATTVLHRLHEVREGEAIGLKEALSWVKGLGYQKVMFELDAKSVVDAVNFDLCRTDVSEFGSIIQQCIYMLDQAQNFHVCYVWRQANKIAHVLARASYSYASPTVWYEPPDCIGALLIDDV